jgi:branched-chain amino acid transport system permease protein
MRVVNFAHGSFMMLGAFALYFLYGGYFSQIPYIVAVPLAAFVVAALAMILEVTVFRWFYHRLLPSMIGLLGLNLVIVHMAVVIWDTYERSIPSTFGMPIQIEGILLPIDRLVVTLIAGTVLGLFWLFMTKSRHGLAMRAAAQDVETAEAQGIDTALIYRLAFFIAMFMTALAGALYGQVYSLSPVMGERPLIVAFIVVVLGGMGSIPGAALGGVILGFSESFLATFYGASVSSFVSFAAVVLLLIVRPWGILGTPEIERA